MAAEIKPGEMVTLDTGALNPGQIFAPVLCLNEIYLAHFPSTGDRPSRAVKDVAELGLGNLPFREVQISWVTDQTMEKINAALFSAVKAAYAGNEIAFTGPTTIASAIASVVAGAPGVGGIATALERVANVLNSAVLALNPTSLVTSLLDAIKMSGCKPRHFEIIPGENGKLILLSVLK